MKSKKILIYCTVFLLCILTVSVLGHFIAPHDAFMTDLKNVLKAPGTDNFFGTDKLGRDILSRILEGAPMTIFSSLAVVGASFVVGVLLGAAAGVFGGITEKIIISATTVFQAFPKFILIVAMAGVLGSGLRNCLLALFIVSWVPYVRVSRSLVISMRNSNYIKAARLCGAGRSSLLLKYIIPNIIEPLIVISVIDIGGVILNMASLSYLGLGVGSPSVEWGSMISEAKDTMLQAPWGIIFPGIAIFIVVTAFNVFGEKLGEYLYE